MPATAEIEAAISETQPATGDKQQPESWFRDTEAALHDELDQLTSTNRRDNEPYASRADRSRLTALCLSGGGIRSAAFCIGALQALASQKMLTQFHYLSTVSGGGFAGGWLQNFIRASKNLEEAVEGLGKGEPQTLAHLREYTNYLSPETGPFSKDTWAGIVLYIRNLILTWLVIIPIFISFPLLLIAYRTIIEFATTLGMWPTLILGSAALFAGTFNACLLVPSHRPEGLSGIDYASWDRILWRVIAPVCAWALLTSGTIRAFIATDTLTTESVRTSISVMGAAYFTVQILAYGAAMLWQQRHVDPDPGSYDRNKWPWLAATLFSSLTLIAGTRLAIDGIAALDVCNPIRKDLSQTLTIAAPIGLVVAHLLQSVIFIGLRRGARLADLDREWVARADGQILQLAFVWTVLAFCCLSLAENLIGANGWLGQQNRPAWIVSIATLFTGPVAAWLGKQVITQAQGIVPSRRTADWLMVGLNVMAVVFAVGLFAMLGSALQYFLGFLQRFGGGCDYSAVLDNEIKIRKYCTNPEFYYNSPILWQLCIAAGICGAIWLFGRVNVNRFSMHGVYRNRLTRAFLGSARKTRDSDPFTDFDESDSPRLRDLKRHRLLPVINVTLNLTNVRRKAWTERKAAPFTITPLACGSAALDRPRAGGDGAPAEPRGAYVTTPDYAGKDTAGDPNNGQSGPLLSGMLTISGAAVSPNWGYHSSPMIAFLMTMFNVRLGAWLPNPAIAKDADIRLAMPRNSVWALLSELTGRSSDTRQAVYLSDGGHFDNLGLYEMLRRRCARIVVVDAGQDEDCTLSDLGSVMRKAEIDGLAKIRMGEIRISSRHAMEKNGRTLGYACGEILYPGAEDPGSLVYIKPTFLPDIPTAVRAYGAGSPTFPHESTTNQWFSESQFESYRALGYFQVSSLFGSRFKNISEWARHLDDIAESDD